MTPMTPLAQNKKSNSVIGSLLFSSCSPKNNPVGSMTHRGITGVIDPDRTTASVADQNKAVEKKDNENIKNEDEKNKSKRVKDPKGGRILLDTPKGATWGVPVASIITSVAVNCGIFFGIWFLATCGVKISPSVVA